MCKSLVDKVTDIISRWFNLRCLKHKIKSYSLNYRQNQNYLRKIFTILKEHVPCPSIRPLSDDVIIIRERPTEEKDVICVRIRTTTGEWNKFLIEHDLVCDSFVLYGRFDDVIWFDQYKLGGIQR